MHPTRDTAALIFSSGAGGRVRYCVASQALFAHSGSNGLPVLSTPYARWINLRITAPITAILLLPLWRKPSAHAWKKGLQRSAVTAGK